MRRSFHSSFKCFRILSQQLLWCSRKSSKLLAACAHVLGCSIHQLWWLPHGSKLFMQNNLLWPFERICLHLCFWVNLVVKIGRLCSQETSPEGTLSTGLCRECQTATVMDVWREESAAAQEIAQLEGVWGRKSQDRQGLRRTWATGTGVLFTLPASSDTKWLSGCHCTSSSVIHWAARWAITVSKGDNVCNSGLEFSLEDEGSQFLEDAFLLAPGKEHLSSEDKDSFHVFHSNHNSPIMPDFFLDCLSSSTLVSSTFYAPKVPRIYMLYLHIVSLRFVI